MKHESLANAKVSPR